MTIEALISDIARYGDRASFEALFTQLAPKVKAYMMLQGALNTVAEEMTRDVFLTIWREADQFDPAERSGLAWIFTIVRDFRIEGLGEVVGHLEN